MEANDKLMQNYINNNYHIINFASEMCICDSLT